MADVKWSSWSDVGTPTTGDKLVGLRDGVNVQFDPPSIIASPWTVGSGTDSAVGGDGTATATGNYSATYGTGSSTNTGNNNFVFGDQLHVVDGGDYNALFGQDYAITVSSNCIVSGGYHPTIESEGSAISGESHTCFGSYVLIAGQENNVTADHSIVGGFFNQANGASSSGHLLFGANNTIATSSTTNYVFCGGNRNSVADGAHYSFIYGNTGTVNNTGSWVIGDSQSTPQSDSTSDQFNSTFAGGHRWYYRNSGTATLASQIDSNGNNITNKGQADQSYSYQTPSTGFTITPAAGVRTLALAPTNTLATGTIALGSLSPVDGQLFRVYTTNTITSLSFSGATVNNAPTSLLAGQGFDLQYNLSNTAWNPLYQSPVAPSIQYSGNTNNSSSGSASYVNHTPNFTIPANYLVPGIALRVTAHFSYTSGSAPPTLSLELLAGATVLAGMAASATVVSSRTNYQFMVQYLITPIQAPSGSSNVLIAPLCSVNNIGTTQAPSNTANPVALATNGSLTLQMASEWSAVGTGTSSITLQSFIVETLG